MRQKAMNTHREEERNECHSALLFGVSSSMERRKSRMLNLCCSCVCNSKTGSVVCYKKNQKHFKSKKVVMCTFNRPSVYQSPKHIELVRSNALELLLRLSCV